MSGRNHSNDRAEAPQSPAANIIGFLAALLVAVLLTLGAIVLWGMP